MERSHERDLQILTAIGEGTPLTQRALAQRVGIALGLTNLYLKRLARKGCIKIVDFPRKPAAGKRLRYILTPKGLAEKTRLTYEHMAYALRLYRRTRDTLREALALLPDAGVKRIALYGTDEAAELAYLTLREAGLEPIGVFGDAAGGQFLGSPVRDVRDLCTEEHDRIVLATFDRPEPHLEKLAGLGLSPAKFLTLRRVDPRALAEPWR
jgi:DNA-binding MarR family transcriptional regulator